MGKYLDGSGLTHLMGLIKSYVLTNTVSEVSWDSTNKKVKRTKNGSAGDVVQFAAGSNVTLTGASGQLTIAATDTTYSEATTSAAGLMSASDKTKLEGIATGAEVNQNAFSNVKVGSTTVAADAKTDTLELVGGGNITITPDATNDKVTITGALQSSGTPAMDGTAARGSSSDAARADHVHPTDTSRAPVSHASSANTYGVGTDSNYGHVKLSDALDGTAAAASGGTAATPKAVSDALEVVAGLFETFETDLASMEFDGVKLNGDGKSYRYGECSTAAATAAKVVTLSSPCNLVMGLIVYCKFTNTNSAAVANLTLAITAPTTAGSNATTTTTAKPIKYRGSNLPAAGTLAASRIYAFVYDGTNWELVGDLDTDTNTKNTAGSTDSSSKLFLVGATSQAANPQTYSQDTVYAGTDGHVYSNSKQAVNLSDSQALTNKTYEGLTLTKETTGFSIAGGTTSKTLTVDESFDLGSASAIQDVLPNGGAYMGKNGGTTYVIVPTGAGYILNSACTKGVDTSIASGSTSTNLPTSQAVASAISTAMSDVAGALVYKGTVGTGGTVSSLPANHTKGWYYIVYVAGTYAGVDCEAGDMIICHTTRSTANNADWDVVQTNIEAISNSEIDTLWAAA